jgi:integrase
MTAINKLHPILRAWLLDGPLADHVPAYVDRLSIGRYAANTASKHLNGVAHFAHWMSTCQVPLGEVDEGCVDQFIRHHLPRCSCLGGALRTPTDVHAALVTVLDILRKAAVLAPRPEPVGPMANELQRYDAYMRDARGLAAGSRRGALRIVERLLVAKFVGRAISMAELQPEDLRQFIADQLASLRTTSNAIAIDSALRCYLRYRASCGDSVHAFLAVIVSPPNWSLTALPRGLSLDEVDRLLSFFTSAVPSHRRGLAIVRLALDLGLRSIEINHLQLADIDWRLGTITLKRTKGRREDVLPLPAVTGLALEDYLRYERPKSSEQAIFVRHLAPHDKPVGVDAIRRVVRDAFRRVSIPHGRSHALRHTLACRIVNEGGSIKEVADILRHRSLNTSLIYAKLDHGALAGVALPWPGSSL